MGRRAKQQKRISTALSWFLRAKVCKPLLCLFDLFARGLSSFFFFFFDVCLLLLLLLLPMQDAASVTQVADELLRQFKHSRSFEHMHGIDKFRPFMLLSQPDGDYQTDLSQRLTFLSTWQLRAKRMRFYTSVPCLYVLQVSIDDTKYGCDCSLCGHDCIFVDLSLKDHTRFVFSAGRV